MNRLIPVTYLCYGCGATVTKYEPMPPGPSVPALEKWNICPDCQRRLKEEEKQDAHVVNHTTVKFGGKP